MFIPMAPDEVVSAYTVGMAVPPCMGGAAIITNMVMIEPPVLEHFDADPVGTAAERRQWVGDTAWRIGGATSAAHFFLAKSYRVVFDSVIKAQGAREVSDDHNDYLRFESPPSAAVEALARVAWEQKLSTERLADEFGKLLKHDFGASGYVPPEACAQIITEAHINTRLMVEALRADATILNRLLGRLRRRTWRMWTRGSKGECSRAELPTRSPPPQQQTRRVSKPRPLLQSAPSVRAQRRHH